jgi:stage IV sporulation protein FB
MLKIRFHTTFWILAILLTLQGKLDTLLFTIFSALAHEGGHAAAAYIKGYQLTEITLMPYGAVLHGADAISKKDGLFIALGGPAVNLCLIILVLALWWLFPATYTFTEQFMHVNLSILLFNLLPVYPLDGARALLSLSKKPMRTLKRLKLSGIVLSVILLVLFIVSAFFKINYTIGILAVMVYISATMGTDKENYKHIASLVPGLKNWTAPVVSEKILVSPNLRLMQLLRQIKPDKILTFEVRDESGKSITVLSESRLAELCAKHKLNSKIKDILQQ